MTVTVRVGNGIDVHVLVIGRSLALCGVAIPFSDGIAADGAADQESVSVLRPAKVTRAQVPPPSRDSSSNVAP